MENQELIVRYIKSQDRISVPDLQQKFSADYLTVSSIIKDLVQEEVLRYESGVTYLVVSRREEQRKERPVGLSYMEQRRREILRKLSFSDDDDDDDDDDVDDLFSDLTEVEDTPPPILAVKKALGEGIRVKAEDGGFFTEPCTEFYGKPVRFRLSLQSGVVYLSDDSLAVSALEKYVTLTEELRARIGEIAIRFGILMDGEEFRIRVGEPQYAFSCMLQLYAAMEQVAMLRETVPAAERREEEPEVEEISPEEEPEVEEISPEEEPEVEEIDSKEEQDAELSVQDDASAPAEYKDGSLRFLAGTEQGRPVYVDLAQINGILICGDSGTGKSCLLHAMICDFISSYSPEDVCLILCDSKGSELPVYRDEPHVLRCIGTKEEVGEALNWCMREMENRYGLFYQRRQEGVPVSKLTEYNTYQPNGERLPRIVVVIDEYSPYMAEKSFADKIQRLSQKSKAAGIHIVMATQVTSILVVTGYLRVEFPVRISFRQIDQGKSFLALGASGAERLYNGEFLMMPRVGHTPQKLLGTALKKEELHSIVEAAARKYSFGPAPVCACPLFEETEATEDVGHPSVDLDALDDDPQNIIEEGAAISEALPEETKRKALAIVVKDGEVSPGKIREVCGLRTYELERILEWMESMGYISPDGEGGRKVFLTRAEFEARFGPLD